MSKQPESDQLDASVQQILHLAKQAGAKNAEAILVQSRNTSISVREGEVEEVESSESQDLGLRVLIGHRQACVSTSDLSTSGLAKMAERAVAMAALAPEDPYCGLASPEQVQTATLDLQLCDPASPDLAQLTERALAAEAAALAVAGVNLPATASASWSTGAVCHRASNGLFRAHCSSFHGASVMALASDDGGTERDWAQTGARWLEDIRDPNAIGAEAGQRAVARLGASKGAGGKLPVLFERRTAKSLLGMFLGGITGSSVARGVSFLKDKMGEQVFADNVSILEQPLRLRGSGSGEIDSEGFQRQEKQLIEQGRLTTWLHNLASARQLQQQPTAHAATGIGSPPGTRLSNVYLAAGDKTPEQLIQQTGMGLVVTDAFGASFNGGTGDWSIGIAGYYFRNGTRAEPFSEMTVAGNMLDIFKIIVPASDLKFEDSMETPSLLVPELTVAGQ
ncbi:TldE protein, part of TldE/TldD proteolytic complex [hydrothermal vent metagenome]|uniref:TldE protein, part of TldE/TldD proteolytic complex n=1 Tax=hydrothermal vent metagenome TaxID=652676 RepID=A0A3B0S2V0_9ZZZZ